MFKDFKQFAFKGNVIDLAIAVIIGGAFGKIVDSLVKDIIMPPIGFILGNIDFSHLYINLSDREAVSFAEAQKAGLPTLNYGVFINNIINFLIIALALFLLVRQVNKLRKKDEPPVPVTTKACPYCLSKIPVAATRCPSCTSHLTTERADSGVLI